MPLNIQAPLVGLAFVLLNISSAVGRTSLQCHAFQLVGAGLVVGLRGTGDSFEKSPLTKEKLSRYLAKIAPDDPPKRMGASVGYSPTVYLSEYEGRAALVAVTTQVSLGPDCTSLGNKQIDVEVEAVGDATSLDHGSLLLTPLVGPDGTAYVMGEGVLTDCSTIKMEWTQRHDATGIRKCVADGGALAHTNIGK